MGKRLKRTRKSRNELSRSQRGAGVLLLMLLLATTLLVFFSTSAAVLISYFTAHRHTASAIEGASLAAARELSSMVVADPDCGYVALGDLAPSSSSTYNLMAEDGKPVPVIGINTLVATARVSMLVAKHLNNEEYMRLAKLDSGRARAAGRRLVDGIKLCLREDPSAPLGKDGKAVRPLTVARKVLIQSLTDSGTLPAVKIKDFSLDLGYLSNGGTTNTPLPISEKLAEVAKVDTQNGCYTAFKNFPVSGESYIFAAVGKQPCLVSKDQFVLDKDSKEIMPSSIVRAKVSLEMVSDKDAYEETNNTFGKIFCVACAAPFALNDKAASGVMIVGLPDGCPSGYISLADYINDPRSSRTNLEMLRAHGGDYPLDARAMLKSSSPDGRVSTLSNVFIQGLYDWVRTAHGRVKLDSLLAIVGDRIQPSEGPLGLGQSVVYRFKKDGAVVVDGYFLSDVPNQIVHDSQVCTLGLNTLRASNSLWTVAFRDQVHNLGFADSGKHSGQLMEIDNCLRPIGSLYSKPLLSAHNDAERKTYFDGGLAVEFVISSPQYQ